MPKPGKPRPKFPARCECGRFHGGRYRQVKNAPPYCFIPFGALSYDPNVHELDAVKVDLSKAPHMCVECQKHG
jgi:hypothetical protein